MKGGYDNGDKKEGLGKEGEEDHEEEIKTQAMDINTSRATNPYHEEIFVVLFFRAEVWRQQQSYTLSGLDAPAACVML